jgi:hypothetical protein
MKTSPEKDKVIKLALEKLTKLTKDLYINSKNGEIPSNSELINSERLIKMIVNIAKNYKIKLDSQQLEDYLNLNLMLYKECQRNQELVADEIRKTKKTLNNIKKYNLSIKVEGHDYNQQK